MLEETFGYHTDSFAFWIPFMARQRSSAPPLAKLIKKSLVVKKSFIGGLIMILAWTLYGLLQQAQFFQPTRLPASNAPVELYSNQADDDLTRLYVQAIDQAQASITLIIYALTDHQVIDALYKKSEAGIPVYIVCDGKASAGISRRLPKATIVKRLAQGLMHQKILIIDEKQIVLGSANLTESSLHVHGNLVIGLDNPALAEALTARAKSMDEEGGVAPLLHRETMAGSQHLELWVLPDDPSAVKRMIDLFRSAKKTIKVAMFTWTRLDFTHELIAAAKRGVKVEVVIDRYSGKGASAKIVHLLDQAGLSVRLSTGKGLLHHKFVYIDGTILANGSANWTNAAFKSNDDYFVVVYPLTTEQRQKMNQVWSVIQQQSEKPGVAIKNTSPRRYGYDD